MPVPIKLIPGGNSDKVSIDYSFLFNNVDTSKKVVTASDKDASLLFEIWEKGQKSEEDVIKVAGISSVTSKDIMRLKTMGFLVGDLDSIKFTRKGKMVITTMSLGEQNQFFKQRSKKSYTEILASMNKKNKRGFRTASCDPKFAINNTNRLNLT